jgi:hypothetical protein
VRWGIGVLLGAGVLINYFDRINLAMTASALPEDPNRSSKDTDARTVPAADAHIIRMESVGKRLAFTALSTPAEAA